MNSRMRSRSSATRSEGAKSMGRGAYRASGALECEPGDQRGRGPAQPDHHGTAAAAAERGAPPWWAPCPPPGAPRAPSRRRPRAPARHAARRPGSRARRSPARRRRMLGTPHSSRSALDQLGLGLVAPAGHSHELALGETRVDLARASVRVAERRLEQPRRRAHERHAAARAEAGPGVVHPAARRAGERLVRRRRHRAPPPPRGRRRSATRAPPARPPARRSGSASADRWPG